MELKRKIARWMVLAVIFTMTNFSSLIAQAAPIDGNIRDISSDDFIILVDNPEYGDEDAKERDGKYSPKVTVLAKKLEDETLDDSGKYRNIDGEWYKELEPDEDYIVSFNVDSIVDGLKLSTLGNSTVNIKSNCSDIVGRVSVNWEVKPKTFDVYKVYQKTNSIIINNDELFDMNKLPKGTEITYAEDENAAKEGNYTLTKLPDFKEKAVGKYEIFYRLTGKDGAEDFDYKGKTNVYITNPDNIGQPYISEETEVRYNDGDGIPIPLDYYSGDDSENYFSFVDDSYVTAKVERLDIEGSAGNVLISDIIKGTDDSPINVVGRYKITFSLKDTTNGKWHTIDGVETTDDQTVIVNVLKKKISMPKSVLIENSWTQEDIDNGVVDSYMRKVIETPVENEYEVTTVFNAMDQQMKDLETEYYNPVWDGSSQHSDLFKARDTGNYGFTLRLIDSDNYVWEDTRDENDASDTDRKLVWHLQTAQLIRPACSSANPEDLVSKTFTYGDKDAFSKDEFEASLKEHWCSDGYKGNNKPNALEKQLIKKCVTIDHFVKDSETAEVKDAGKYSPYLGFGEESDKRNLAWKLTTNKSQMVNWSNVVVEKKEIPISVEYKQAQYAENRTFADKDDAGRSYIPELKLKKIMINGKEHTYSEEVMKGLIGDDVQPLDEDGSYSKAKYIYDIDMVLYIPGNIRDNLLTHPEIWQACVGTYEFNVGITVYETESGSPNNEKKAAFNKNYVLKVCGDNITNAPGHTQTYIYNIAKKSIKQPSLSADTEQEVYYNDAEQTFKIENFNNETMNYELTKGESIATAELVESGDGHSVVVKAKEIGDICLKVSLKNSENECFEGADGASEVFYEFKIAKNKVKLLPRYDENASTNDPASYVVYDGKEHSIVSMLKEKWYEKNKVAGYDFDDVYEVSVKDDSEEAGKDASTLIATEPNLVTEGENKKEYSYNYKYRLKDPEHFEFEDDFYNGLEWLASNWRIERISVTIPEISTESKIYNGLEQKWYIPKADGLLVNGDAVTTENEQYVVTLKEIGNTSITFALDDTKYKWTQQYTDEQLHPIFAIVPVPTNKPEVTPTAAPTGAPGVISTSTPTDEPGVITTAVPTDVPAATPAATPAITPVATPVATPDATPKPSDKPATTPKPSDKPGETPGVTLKLQKITTAKIKAVKAKTLKKKAVTIKLKAKTDGKGKLTYKVTGYPKKMNKFIKVSKSGVVTLKKKAKKGIYKITITAAAKGDYKKTTKVVSIKVK